MIHTSRPAFTQNPPPGSTSSAGARQQQEALRWTNGTAIGSGSAIANDLGQYSGCGAGMPHSSRPAFTQNPPPSASLRSRTPPTLYNQLLTQSEAIGETE